MRRQVTADSERIIEIWDLFTTYDGEEVPDYVLSMLEAVDIPFFLVERPDGMILGKYDGCVFAIPTKGKSAGSIDFEILLEQLKDQIWFEAEGLADPYAA